MIGWTCNWCGAANPPITGTMVAQVWSGDSVRIGPHYVVCGRCGQNHVVARPDLAFSGVGEGGGRG